MLSEWAIDKSLLYRIFLNEKIIIFTEWSDIPSSVLTVKPRRHRSALLSFLAGSLRSPRYLASQTPRYPSPSNYYYFFYGKKADGGR